MRRLLLSGVPSPASRLIIGQSIPGQSIPGLLILGLVIPFSASAEVPYPPIDAYQARVYEQLGAQCIARMGLHDSCSDFLETAIRFNPSNADTHALLGWIFYRNQQPEKALSEFAECLRLDPKQLSALKAMGDIHCLQGRYTLAEEKYRRYFEAAPADPMGPYSLAAVAALRGQEETCLEHLQGALELGFSNQAMLRADPRFASVRESPAFKTLLETRGGN